jgi:hypothetical protein
MSPHSGYAQYIFSTPFLLMWVGEYIQLTSQIVLLFNPKKKIKMKGTKIRQYRKDNGNLVHVYAVSGTDSLYGSQWTMQVSLQT